MEYLVALGMLVGGVTLFCVLPLLIVEVIWEGR